jgi:uncharacterized membrane protein
MDQLIEPNLHPLIVHFVIAFLITGPMLLLASAFSSEARRTGLQIAGDWMLALGTVAVIIAVAAGLQAYYSVAHDGPSHVAMTDHRNWAFVTCGAFLVFALWRFFLRHQAPSRIFVILLLVPVLALGVTGWKGGHLVYHYGIGVASLPAVTGDGHDHDHGDGAPPGHDEPPAGKQGEDDHHAVVADSEPRTSQAHESAKGEAAHTEPVPQVEKPPEHDHSTHDHSTHDH